MSERRLADLFHDGHEQLGVEDGAGLGEAAQGKARQAEPGLEFVELADLLQAAHAGQDGAEEVEQQKGAVFIIVERALRVRAVLVERGQQVHDLGDELDALDVARLDGGLALAHGDHDAQAGVRVQATFLCLFRLRGRAMRESTKHAEQYCSEPAFSACHDRPMAVFYV